MCVHCFCMYNQKSGTSKFLILYIMQISCRVFIHLFLYFILKRSNRHHKHVTCELPLNAWIMAWRVSREIPLCPLARTLILRASSMRVLSGLSGFPTPTCVGNAETTTTTEKCPPSPTALLLFSATQKILKCNKWRQA